MPAPTDANAEVALEAEETKDGLGEMFSRPPMKHSDTRDSISSNDSDVSLSYETSTAGESSSNLPNPGDDERANMADQSDCGSETGSTTGKDSGCEVVDHSEPPFVPPDDELANRIVTQVEFYFSDVNITKDAFLLKHVKRNKEGFVSLKLISSFKRVKHLAKDWRVVASALTRSTKLQINEAGTKLRRLAPLPQYDETTPSRTVVAMHLPQDKPTIENVAELFSCYGDIALVRILRPGNPIPADVRSFVAKRPELNGVVCALVEFVQAESARKAVQMQNRNWRGYSQGIRVVELNAPVQNNHNNGNNNNNNNNNNHHHQNDQPRTKKRSLPSKKTALARFFDSEYSSSCASGSEAESELRPRSGSGGSLDFRQRLRRSSSSSSGNPNRSPSDFWTGRRYTYSRDSGSETSSSSLYSRSRSNTGCSDCSTCSSSSPRPRSNSGVSHLPENVIRLPLGPDGSKGFHKGFRERFLLSGIC